MKWYQWKFWKIAYSKNKGGRVGENGQVWIHICYGVFLNWT